MLQPPNGAAEAPARFPNEAFAVGDEVEAMSPLVVRESEDMFSKEVVQVKPGQKFLIKERGTQTGNRLRVEFTLPPAGGEEIKMGWVSVIAQSGRLLLAPMDPARIGDLQMEGKAICAKLQASSFVAPTAPAGRQAKSVGFAIPQSRDYELEDEAAEKMLFSCRASDNAAFPVGSELIACANLALRAEEALDSKELQDIEGDSRLVVLELGAGIAMGGTGRRLRVGCLGTYQEGWISCRARSGAPLVEIAPPSCEIDLHVAYPPGSEIVSLDTIAVREKESLESAEMGELPGGCRMVVLALGAGVAQGGNGRRLHVQCADCRGWISCRARSGRQLVETAHPEVRDVKEVFPLGCPITTLDRVSVWTMESVDSPPGTEFPAASDLLVVEHGAGCRIKVKSSDSGRGGWINSHAMPSGRPLVVQTAQCLARPPAQADVAQLQAALEALDKRLPPGPRICILGGTHVPDEGVLAIIKAIAEEFSRQLAGKAVVITGGLPGMQEIFSENLDRAFPALVNLMPKGQRSAGGGCRGEDIEVANSLQERMEIFARVGHIYISCGGGRAVATEAKIAFERGARVLPVVATGGASAGMFDFPQGALCPPRGIAPQQWEHLCRGAGVPPEVVAHALVSIIQDLVSSTPQAEQAPRREPAPLREQVPHRPVQHMEPARRDNSQPTVSFQDQRFSPPPQQNGGGLQELLEPMPSPFPGWSPTPGFKRGDWEYICVDPQGLRLRSVPVYSKGVKAGRELLHGEVVRICERGHEGGITWLCLADGRGWAFERTNRRRMSPVDVYPEDLVSSAQSKQQLVNPLMTRPLPLLPTPCIGSNKRTDLGPLLPGMVLEVLQKVKTIVQASSDKAHDAEARFWQVRDTEDGREGWVPDELPDKLAEKSDPSRRTLVPFESKLHRRRAAWLSVLPPGELCPTFSPAKSSSSSSSGGGMLRKLPAGEFLEVSETRTAIFAGSTSLEFYRLAEGGWLCAANAKGGRAVERLVREPHCCPYICEDPDGDYIRKAPTRAKGVQLTKNIINYKQQVDVVERVVFADGDVFLGLAAGGWLPEKKKDGSASKMVPAGSSSGHAHGMGGNHALKSATALPADGGLEQRWRPPGYGSSGPPSEALRSVGPGGPSGPGAPMAPQQLQSMNSRFSQAPAAPLSARGPAPASYQGGQVQRHSFTTIASMSSMAGPMSPPMLSARMSSTGGLQGGYPVQQHPQMASRQQMGSYQQRPSSMPMSAAMVQQSTQQQAWGRIPQQQQQLQSQSHQPGGGWQQQGWSAGQQQASRGSQVMMSSMSSQPQWPGSAAAAPLPASVAAGGGGNPPGSTAHLNASTFGKLPGFGAPAW
eukprot:TRINITY_DN59070_c0_g2_i2.p1 TRINITY_DN59070_c0_g2~~TRINITY_DN59070_c0_g2_i2.p1  ORF type:complete len:1336 (+),score=319.15 TRINITY_DN59070_c0_g2_i2:76-4083(+)